MENSRIILPDDCSSMVRELYEYWISIHPGEGLPGRQHFDPLDVIGLSANIWMLDVEHNPLRFRFRRLGLAMINFTGRDSTGKYIDEIYSNVTSTTAWEHLVYSTEYGKPTFRRDAIISNPEKKYVMSERLNLPLASDGCVVDMLLNMTCYLGPVDAGHRHIFSTIP